MAMFQRSTLSLARALAGANRTNKDRAVAIADVNLGSRLNVDRYLVMTRSFSNPRFRNGKGFRAAGAGVHEATIKDQVIVG
jgi:hypothetical protein